MGFLPLSNMQNFKIKINKPKIKINKPKINLPKLNIVKPSLPKVNLPKVVLPKIDLQINAVEKLKTALNSKGALVLLPYKSLMVNLLKKKGLPVSKSTKIEEVAILFYKSVILGRQNFKNLQHLSDVELDSISSKHADVFGSVTEGVTKGMIKKDQMTAKQKKFNDIFLAILKWIKNALDKKKKGQQLSEDEKEVENSPMPEIEKTPEKKKKKGNWFTRLIQSIFGGGNDNEDFENFRRRISARNRELNVLSSPSIVTPRTVGATLSNYTCNATELQADLMSKGLNFNGMYVNPVQSANDYLNLTRNLGTKKVIVTTPKNFNH